MSAGPRPGGAAGRTVGAGRGLAPWYNEPEWALSAVAIGVASAG